MKDKHKNRLLGFLVGKSSQSSGSEDEINIVQTILTFCLTIVTSLIVYFLTHPAGTGTAIFHMSEARSMGFTILTAFVSLFIFSKLFLRFPRFMYLLIFGPRWHIL